MISDTIVLSVPKVAAIQNLALVGGSQPILDDVAITQNPLSTY